MEIPTDGGLITRTTALQDLVRISPGTAIGEVPQLDTARTRGRVTTGGFLKTAVADEKQLAILKLPYHVEDPPALGRGGRDQNVAVPPRTREVDRSNLVLDPTVSGSLLDPLHALAGAAIDILGDADTTEDVAAVPGEPA